MSDNFRRKLHLIADEMYCMSVFDSSTSFHSVLEVHRSEFLDANLLHVIWGFSKVSLIPDCPLSVDPDLRLYTRLPHFSRNLNSKDL